MSDIEHSGLHALFFLDGVAAGAEKALQLFEETILFQQGELEESVADMSPNASDYDYAVGDIRVLKDAVDDVQAARRRMRLARATLDKRTG